MSGAPPHSDPPAPHHSPVTGFEIESSEQVGGGGFLTIRRVRMRNRRADGSLSDRYLCDFVERPYGMDAIVVAVWHRDADRRVQVLVRDALRPALALGRDPARTPVADPRAYRTLTELVAGIVEVDDRGPDGIRARAAAEVHEEAGFAVAAGDVVMLGAGTFPTPGSMPEKFHLAAVEVDPAGQGQPAGDGSPMEEGAGTRWLDLDAAIAACIAGEIEDAKTELTLRRLRDRLAGT